LLYDLSTPQSKATGEHKLRPTTATEALTSAHARLFL
jgi:hypothetical protein